ncbi:7408_t:CDS:2 [Acaulospora morrowiae]|uniref:7408_t:CDS:1 n=1 Tax=Acaulospora morrowiae TaxID=94023 RepID=A0A9N9BB08_9GLOM|nr:7408_t:CDS:2 [Acaulospora morrowiae]
MVPQYIKKGLTKEEYERQKNLRENGDDPNVEDINGVIDGDTALISPYEEATKVEKEWLKQFVTHEAQATLFEKLIKYFNGKHHTEEIVFRENIKPRELGKILNLMGVASKIVWC